MSVNAFEQRLENMESDIRRVKEMLSELLEWARNASKPHLEESIMSAREVADFLRLDINIIYSKCSRGEIPFFKVGKLYKFRKSEILRWMAQQDKDSGFSVDDYVTRYLQENNLRG